MCKYCNGKQKIIEHTDEFDGFSNVVITSDGYIGLNVDGYGFIEEKINFCPMCGKDLKENNCKECANYNVGDGIDDIRNCYGCKFSR